MPNQSWLDTFNVFPVQGGTVEARLDGLNVLPTQIGTVEARLDGIDIVPTQVGTVEARLEGLDLFVIYSYLDAVAVVGDLVGTPTVPLVFDGSASLNTLSYLWKVTSVPGGSAAFPPQELSDNGVSGIISMSNNAVLYHCNEAAGLVGTDTSGNANDAVLTGGAVAAAPAQIGAFSWGLPSATAYAYAGAAIAIPGDWAAAMWFFNLAPVTTWRTALRGATAHHPIIINNAGTLGAFIGGFFGTDTAFNMSVAAYAGWHHIAVVGTGGQLLYYVDGVYVGSVSNSTTDSLYAFGNYQGGGQRFSDRIDEIGVWQRALTAAEITNLYTQNGWVGATFPFTPDLAGTYTVQLTVTGGNGTDSTLANAVVSVAASGTLGPFQGSSFNTNLVITLGPKLQGRFKR